MQRARIWLVLGCASAIVACSDQAGSGGASGASGQGASGAGGAGASTAGSGMAGSGAGGAGAAGAAGTGGSGGSELPPSTLRVTLPQAARDAAWANPGVYPVLPVRVKVAGGTPQAVRARVGDGAWVDAAASGDGFLARVPIGALADGLTTLEAEASEAGKAPARAMATLGIGRAGVQFTQFSRDGSAGTPALHATDHGLFLTWADRSDGGHKKAWIQEVDGAGRGVGTKVALVARPEEVLTARVAFGGDEVAVLYQVPSAATPYMSYLTVLDRAGSQRLAPIALDPMGMNGSFSGGVVWDGTGFVAVWRSWGGTPSEIRWMRVEGTSHRVTGPVVVTRAGAGTAAEPIGGFEPFSFVTVQAVGATSVIGFVRAHWSVPIDLAIPRSEVAVVSADGTVTGPIHAGLPEDYTFHRECRPFRFGDGFALVWSAKDLTSPEDNIPNKLFAARMTAAGALDPMRGAGALMFDAREDRDEPFLLDRPGGAVMAWTDQRSYAVSLQTGRIELYLAPVGPDLKTAEPVIFPHARFVAGTSDLSMESLGTNVMLTWSDERHGMGIADPKPEVYLETGWF